MSAKLANSNAGKSRNRHHRLSGSRGAGPAGLAVNFACADDGTPFAELLASKGVVPGIKVDTGAKPFALFPGETVTEGLDGLRERLEEYRELGARFAKWRAVITIGDGIPTDACIDANACIDAKARPSTYR